MLNQTGLFATSNCKIIVRWKRKNQSWITSINSWSSNRLELKYSIQKDSMWPILLLKATHSNGIKLKILNSLVRINITTLSVKLLKELFFRGRNSKWFSNICQKVLELMKASGISKYLRKSKCRTSISAEMLENLMFSLILVKWTSDHFYFQEKIKNRLNWKI